MEVAISIFIGIWFVIVGVASSLFLMKDLRENRK